MVTSELSSELSAAEVQAQLSELARELEQRGNKKHKYKQLYLDEKEKCSFLQRHYFDEVKKYQEELEKLKHSMEYVKTEEACRVKGLQVINHEFVPLDFPKGLSQDLSISKNLLLDRQKSP